MQNDEPYKKRLEKTLNHLQPENELLETNQVDQESFLSARKKKGLRTDGWGYADTEFALDKEGQIFLSGDRYLFSGETFPQLREYFENEIGVSLEEQKEETPFHDLPEPIRNDTFLKGIENHCSHISFENEERIFHSHGQTVEEVVECRYQKIERYVDAIVYPANHQHVEKIVNQAVISNVCLIVFGGGTSVSLAVKPPKNESRMIISLDMHLLNQVLWVDSENNMASIASGAVGKEIEHYLNNYQIPYTLGHEPDSCEFSTLGGWISTRASGMKKNVYGNIEDILLSVTIVTPSGTIQTGTNTTDLKKQFQTQGIPRKSIGPDIQELILGSEGTLGVITSAVLKIKPKPQFQKYGSLVFPDFESGVNALKDITKQGYAPASIRLVDPTQFKFGQVLKPVSNSNLTAIIDKIKKWYVTSYKGFNVDTMCAATLLFISTESMNQIVEQENKILEIASKYGGLNGGSANGERGYFLTYMIAYLRDWGLRFHFIAESFETSTAWSNIIPLITNVKQKLIDESAAIGIERKPWVSARVTQTYDTGVCIYFYFGFNCRGVKDPVHKFTILEDAARQEVLDNGGSISHHHGVGKLRKQFMGVASSPATLQVLKDLKRSLDPQNVFAVNNLIDFY